MFNCEEMIFAADKPYPDINISEHNHRYGRMMLDNLGGCNSEMSAVSLYLYNNLITEKDFKDISYIFHKIMIVEMHHIDIFGRLSTQLGENPRLWTYKGSNKTYWTPAYNSYPTLFGKLMHNALNGELAAIEKYEKQLALIDNKCISDNLRRIILDEKIHVDIFRLIIKECDL